MEEKSGYDLETVLPSPNCYNCFNEHPMTSHQPCCDSSLGAKVRIIFDITMYLERFSPFLIKFDCVFTIAQ